MHRVAEREAPASAADRPAAAQSIAPSSNGGITPALRGAMSLLGSVLRPKLLPNHYAPLHGLRVIAIVLVVQLHATSALQRLRIISFSTDHLWFGMDMFFFLSGFLIGSMLLAESRSGERVDMLRFYLRRSFRIVPPYLVVLTVLVLTGDHPLEKRANLWFEYLYLTNYVPPRPDLVIMPWAWSLAVEEHFYLVVPLLVTALRGLRSQRAQLLLLALLWFSALPVRFWTFAVDGPWDGARMMDVFYVQSHLRYDILVAGIFTAYVQHHHGDALGRRFRQGWARHLAAGLSAVFLALILFTQGITVSVPWYSLVCWGTYTSLAYAPLVLVLLNRESAVSRMLSARVFLYIATFGYGIYLIHIPVIWVLVLPLGAHVTAWAGLTVPMIWLFVIGAALGISTFGGYLIHLLIEKPALVLRDRFSP